jgi:NAD(P)-dependent dehydrogenase (short-subunit alcohol dehydrogenase family)
MAPGTLDERTVVVFGGTGALGRAVVTRAIEDQATVVVADRTTPAPSDRFADVTYSAVNALDEQEVASFFASLDPTPWAVVNLIGGYTPDQALIDLDISVLRQQLELNLVAAALVTKYALARMAPGGAGGRLIHTSSRVATDNGRGHFAYSVSKLAVVRLVEAAAAEARDDGITVNCIMPSVIDTPANRTSLPAADHARWPKAEQIAAVVSFLISDDAELVSAAAIPVYGRV